MRNAASEAASPVRKATAVKTAALAASTATRCGAAVSVERIDPVAYSPVTVSTPSTPMASWARKNPLWL
jgi:hypothetical protein